jgi:hypothetical protein
MSININLRCLPQLVSEGEVGEKRLDLESVTDPKGGMHGVGPYRIEKG